MANPAISSLSFIISTLFDLYALVVAIRFIMEAVGASNTGQITQFLVSATRPLLAPLERVMPRFRNFNIAALLLCFLVLLLKGLILKAMAQSGIVGGFRFPLAAMHLGGVVYFALLSVVSLIFNVFIFSIVILALLSWVSPDPRSPIYEILNPIAYPVLSRVRRYVPPMGGLDLSALFSIIGLYAMKILVVGLLAQLYMGGS